MARHIAQRAAPKEASTPQPISGRLHSSSPTPHALPRRQRASNRPSAAIQQEVAEVIESVLGAPVASVVPLMQVLHYIFTARFIRVIEDAGGKMQELCTAYQLPLTSSEEVVGRLDPISSSCRLLCGVES